MFFAAPCMLLYLIKFVVLSLRMYPGAGMVERVAARDDVIPLRFPVRSPDGSYVNAIPVKAGQKVLVSNPAVDRLQCVWGPDASVWRPERWFETESLPSLDKLNIGWGRTFAFSQGPRSCIGYRLGECFALVSLAMTDMIAALYEMKVRSHLSHRLYQC